MEEVAEPAAIPNNEPTTASQPSVGAMGDLGRDRRAELASSTPVLNEPTTASQPSVGADSCSD